MGPLFNTTDALKKVRMAFNALRKEGIEAHMDYHCCANCGSAVVPLFSSLVYCLHDDVQGFRSSGVLFIRFSSPDPDPSGQRALGDQVRIMLERHGLNLEWDGSPNESIAVMA